MNLQFTTKTVWLAIWTGVISFGSIPCCLVAQEDGLKFEPQVVIREPFPAIVEPKFVSIEEANNRLHVKELVLGVEINGKARAYPINMLTGPQREIINDKLGGTLIAATW